MTVTSSYFRWLIFTCFADHDDFALSWSNILKHDRPWGWGKHYWYFPVCLSHCLQSGILLFVASMQNPSTSYHLCWQHCFKAQKVSPVWSDHLYRLLGHPLLSCWHTSGHDHSCTENSPKSHHFYCRVKSAVLISASKTLHHFVLMSYWINVICPFSLCLFYSSYTCLLAVLHSIQPSFCPRAFALAVSEWNTLSPDTFMVCSLTAFKYLLKYCPPPLLTLLISHFIMYYVSPFILVYNFVFLIFW